MRSAWLHTPSLWLWAAPLAWLLGSAAQLQQPSLWPLGAYAALAGAGLVGAAAAWRWRRLALLALACAALAAGQAGWRAHLRLAERLPAALDGQTWVADGKVVGLPQPSPDGVVFLFAPERAWRADGGAASTLPPLVRVAWSRGYAEGPLRAGPPPQVVSGERWMLPLQLAAPHGLANPGGWDAELAAFEAGIGAVGRVQPRSSTAPQRLEPAPPGLGRWRQALRDRVLVHGGEFGGDAAIAGLLAGLLVGDQAAIAPATWQVLRVSGTAHLLAVSGLHIALFAVLGRGLVGWLWRRSATLCAWWPAPHAAACAGVLAALAYALLAGWGVPAQRTVWMVAAAALLRAGGLRWPVGLSWAWVAALVVALDPWALLQAGFWLSFGAVALLLLAPAPSPALQPQPWRTRAGQALRAHGHTQLRAGLLLAPLAAALFHQVSLVGVLANLVAIPWVTLVTTPLTLAGALLPPLWTLAAWTLAPLMELLNWAAAWPWAAWTAPAASAWALALAALGTLLLAAPLPPLTRLAGLPLLLPLLVPPPQRLAPGEFELLVPDVGQGGAALVRTARHALLHDTGPAAPGGAGSDAGQRVLLPLLAAEGVRGLDMLLLSHRDSDHTGGAASVMAGVPVAQLLHTLEVAHPLLVGAPPATLCRAGQRWVWDGVAFEVLHPTAADAAAAQVKGNTNAGSCVLRVVAASGASVLLTGDIEAAQEDALRQRATAALPSTVLVAPHHGSQTSSTAAFIAATAPEVALMQHGWRNRFGHPAPSVLARYAAAGVAVRTSGDCGAWRWRSSAPHPAASGECERALRRRYWQAQTTQPTGQAQHGGRGSMAPP